MKREVVGWMKREVVGWMKRRTMKWHAQCHMLLRVTVDLRLVTFNMRWKGNDTHSVACYWEWLLTCDWWHSTCAGKWTLHQLFSRVHLSHTSRGNFSLGSARWALWLLTADHREQFFMAQIMPWLIICKNRLFFLILWPAMRLRSATPHQVWKTKRWCESKWRNWLRKKWEWRNLRKGWWPQCSGIMKMYCKPNTCDSRERSNCDQGNICRDTLQHPESNQSRTSRTSHQRNHYPSR